MEYLMNHCQTLFAQHHGMFLTLFIAGLVGGFTHCAGMCGPFVMAQMRQLPQQQDAPVMRRLTGAALLPYHLGRMTTYCALGTLAALMARQIIGMPAQRGAAFVFLAVAGLLFIVNAFPRMKQKLHSCCQPALSPTGKLLAKLASPLLKQAGMANGYALGVLLGLMPCGLVFAALMAVSTLGRPLEAGLAMAFFTSGTMLALWLVGLGGQFAFRLWPRAMQGVTRMAMMVSGITLLVLAGNIVV